jgi:hypothetical protein
MEIKAGRFKGRGIAGSEQYGTSGENETLQIGVDVNVPALERSVTCFLYFSPAAYPYSIDRLRAMGWEGDDIRDLLGIDKNEIDVEIREEEYQGTKRWKVEIQSGPGKVQMKSQIGKDDFARRFAAVTGGAGSPSPAATTGTPSGRADPKKPPF